MSEAASTIGSVVQTAGAIAQGAGAIKSLVSGTPKMPKTPDTPSLSSAADVLAQADTEEDRRKRLISQGMTSNMLTGATGVLSSSESTGKRTLGGS
jgi:hypothetical protein